MPVSNQPDNPETQAAYWRAQLSSDLATTEQRRKFEIWLNDQPENKIAWLEINDFWAGLDHLTEADVMESAKSRAAVLATAAPVRSNSRFARPSLARAAAIMLVASGVFTQIDFYAADYTTAPGKQRSLSLADGSEIIMNSDTAVSVDYSKKLRQITLHDGEAYFRVAADSSRPFQVKTDYGRVRALGTSFNIKIRPKDETVTVYQHAVKVETASGKVLEALAEGREVVFTETLIHPVISAHLPRVTAWRNHRMVFQNQPLAEVIAELERYRSGKIIILDGAIKGLPVTGVFDTKDTNIALKTIEQSLPVRATKMTEKLVLLSAK